MELSAGGVTLVGDSAQVRPAGVEADTVRSTALLKPFRDETVIVDVPESPARIWAGLTAPAETEKSAAAVTWNVMLAVVCESEPLAPVTVTT